MRGKLKEVKDELRRRMHQPIPEQGKWLGQVVGGFFGYHAVPTNGPALSAFRHHVTELWLRTLRRRSQKVTSRGNGSPGSQTTGCPNLGFYTHGRTPVLPSNTRGGSRMP